MLVVCWRSCWATRADRPPSHVKTPGGAKAAMEHFHIYLYSVNHRATGYMTIIPDTGLSHISRCAGVSNIDMLFEPSS